MTYFLVQTPYLRKFWVASYGPICSQKIRLKDSWIVSISRRNLSFLHGDGSLEGSEISPNFPRLWMLFIGLGAMARLLIVQNERLINI